MFQPQNDHEVECGSEQDEILLPSAEPARWGWKRTTGVAVSVALLLAVAVLAARSASSPSSTESVEDAVGLANIEYTPPHDQCSRVKDNCLATGCCQVAGYQCFYSTIPGVGKCMKPAKCAGCAAVAPHTVAVSEFPGMSLFCFSVYTNNTGNTKRSYELELLQGQKKAGVGMFRCAEHNVFSDVDRSIAPGYSTVKVTDVKGDWHFAKRKSTGAWVNTGMFVQIWKKIGEMGTWARHNYVVKVDPDTVFFANKLVEALRGNMVPAEGAYYENCPYVEYGYFGNLEVYSKNAFGTLLAQLEDCYAGMDWKKGIKNGKYGPMGEDLFAQKCMDRHWVKKIEQFDLTRDGACPADRPQDQKKNKKYIPSCGGATTVSIHPFKKPEAWFKCMQEADQAYPR